MEVKPGVMIYFDMLPILQRLSEKHAGILFRAILEYGAGQTIPELPRQLQMFWPLIQMRLDTDDEHYYQTKCKRKYAVYVRWCKDRGQEPLSYSEWLADLELREKEDALHPDAYV